MSFYNAFDLPLTIVRPFNTYGPRQSARAIIPTIITQIASGVRQLTLGDLRPTRDFNFVKDTCRGFLAIAECDETIGLEINVSSKSEISIEDTLNLIKEIMKSDAEFIFDKKRIRPENSEVLRLCGDNTLINGLTGYKPEYDIQKGLKQTCDWFTNPNHLKNYKTTINNV